MNEKLLKGGENGKLARLSKIATKLKEIKANTKWNLLSQNQPNIITKVQIIKKSIAIAKTKAVMIQNSELQK